MQIKLIVFLRLCMLIKVRGLQRRLVQKSDKNDFNLCDCNIHGNLGGLGGVDIGDLGPEDVDDNGEMKKELRYKGVTTLASGDVLDLVVTNTSEYFPNPENPKQAAESGDTSIGGEWMNGRKECIGRINFKAPGEVSLKFTFVLSGTDTVAPAANWDFTIMDFDQSKQGMYESFTVQGLDSWYSTGTQPIMEAGGDAYTFGSPDDNVQVPNPTSVYNLDEDQLDSSVGMVFVDKSEWEMTFKATDAGEDHSGGRNLFFAGRTLLQDLGDVNQDETVILTTATTTAVPLAAPTPVPLVPPTPVPLVPPTPAPFFDPTPAPTDTPPLVVTTQTTTECPPEMWSTTLPPQSDGDDGTCVIYADPHIDTFDNPSNGPFLSRIAYFDSGQPSLSLLSGKADVSSWRTTGPTIDVNEYEHGDFWLVKNDAIHIQGRYNVSVEFGGSRSGLSALAVGGPLLGGGTVIVEPKVGGLTMFGKKILKKGNYSERTPAGPVSVRTFYNAYTEGNVAPNGVDITLPSKVLLQVRQYNTHLDAKISIPKSLGETDGQCGNFNGDPLDDTLDQIQQRMVDMTVPSSELLFASPFLDSAE